MKKYIPQISVFIMLINLAILLSCRTRERNYIIYYNKVNEIDSIYRMANEPEKAIKKYRRLFRKYDPKNQERINEYETYIKLADQYHKNFGGQKSLYKLIPLVAPYWKYKKEDLSFIKLYKKYGIDSLRLESEIVKWNKSLNKKLVDSFTIAFLRDQAEGRANEQLMMKNDKKNDELFKWTFQNYGYPSLQKIGLMGNNDVPLYMSAFHKHMAFSEDYPYFKAKLLEYVKSGDCLPRDYATMVDRHNLQVSREEVLYGYYIGYDTVLDTIKVDRNRKSIGLPGMKHSAKIAKDFLKK
ncbi:hypothetical protein [Chryseobacterium gossypii]|uniref:hypothetical protein n=1 Tax=Chryseobacterium gossypii TaxID=3231602 RepID=UPI003524BD86